ncbi:MAG: 4-alpha-glucanotransferase [Verrucomicrobia bacterium]|nr:4-alpha-glucanotransferase [Verrucomicrobiota bacterium]
MQNSGSRPSPSGPPLFSWLRSRSAGALLHPTCFPGDQGIGVLDDSVDRLLQFLSAAGIRNWQFCPLGPTGYGDSPYQCFSAFAGNPYLIDLQALVRAGLLADVDLATLRELPRDHVDFGWLYVTKWPVLFRAYQNFKAGAGTALPYGDFEKFKADRRAWLEPYAFFLALKDHFQGQPWWEWPAEVRFFTQAKLSPLAGTVADRAEAHAFFQYLFFGQWQQVRAKARALNIELIGDAPIFVARDSADVWSNPHLFQLDPKTGHPLFVAGVPPDYFSADGQLWGNPLYAWDVHHAEGYTWWIDRLRANFDLCDIVRIDHFRGFDTYWSIPADAKNARVGEWKKGPGLAFFEAVKASLPNARLIAEDLGDLFPSVLELRDATGLPGMTILQFGFGGESDNLYLPHNLTANSVIYPGTHDNDTTLGWYAAADEKTRDHVRSYFRISGQEISWDFIRIAYASVSNLAVIPLQDFLSLDSRGRFNTPGQPAGNWQWRYSAEQLDHLLRDSAAYLHKLGGLYSRG